MLEVRTQRKVEFVTVERPTAWVVVAFLVEIRGDEKTILSGPKVVRIIAKQTLGLPGAKKGTSILALPAPISTSFAVRAPIASPFVSHIFGFTNSDVVIGLAARPPTTF